MSEEEVDNKVDNSNKVIFLGESSVGKTNLIKVSVGKPFDPHSMRTCTSSFLPKEFIYNNKRYIFNLWDTIGEEKYRSVTKMFFKGAIIVLLIYDITKKSSFDALCYWLEEVKNEIGNNFILGVVGNKSDLYIDEEVSQEEAKNFAESKRGKFKISSAKEDPLSFIEFLEELFKDYIDNYENKKLEKPRGLTNRQKTEKKKDSQSTCC